ncbi:class IIb bacteriocin, lactobin A/cerein 7B family [Clostridium cellulovorans]|uniref:Uncharacterized protein n=1 Tax=Clostridium cellulovorans (strain ATCC 35296 / DSM 3052 / OCM 3 / 743B) TaxID=573061 RepID=D9SMD4_CLOC7|nr:class IIb bacteriocin, lactobin A/cerein 7B family [Clostridium cellulovorans]ADL53790.1 hypothetical protein Clocel_4129 [Clostridium cellulovorans 743B]
MEGFKPIKDLENINGGILPINVICYGVVFINPVTTIATTIANAVKKS